MNCYFNKSNKIQSFVQMSGFPFTIPANGAIPEMTYPDINGSSAFVKVSMDEWYRSIRKEGLPLLVKRSRALGDVLMLRSLMPYLKKEKDISIHVLSNQLDFIFQDVNTRENSVFSFNIDNTVEKDHSFTRFSKMHRIDIFAEAFDLKIDSRVLDFNLDFSSKERLFKDDYILVQGTGSADVKTLNDKLFNRTVQVLRESFPDKKILILDNRKPTTDINNIMVSKVKYSFSDFWNIVKYASFMVCLDSGPLWVSHFTKTPVVALLGSTPISTRLTYHPLYEKNGALGIELFKLIGCKQCNEQATFCKFKYSCLGPGVDLTSFEEVFENKLQQIGDFLYGTRN